MPGKATVWITGAGSGIGAALVRKYTSDGWNVILSGRKESKLKAIEESCIKSGIDTYIIPLDLTKSESLKEAVEKARSLVPKIDLLINNGGLSQRSFIEETPIEIDRKIFDTNFFGTVEFTKLVLPWMMKTGGGRISVVSSISGLFGFPMRSSYSASKHALVGFFETLELECYDKNIRTSIIFPGRIATEISKSAITQDGKAQGTMDDGLSNGMDVDVCARKIKSGLDRGKRRILVGGKELLMVYFHKYLPFIFFRIARKIDPR